MEIRNIAIIAHVDHGKTTLTDALMRQTGAVEEGTSMDSNTLEKERGITIYAKNASLEFNGSKINIVDTPGHADFGSEVERVLRSIDSVLLVVDAQEGPMPQTRFVLKKSLELGLKPIVVINKIDKPAADPHRCEEQVLELFLELGASDDQANFPVVYSIGRLGIAKIKLEDNSEDLTPLLNTIIKYVPPASNSEHLDRPLKAQPFNLGYDNFLGRLAVARIYDGKINVGQNVFIKKPGVNIGKGKVTKIFTFKGLQKVEEEEAVAGDIVLIAGLPNIDIGETITSDENTEALSAIEVDEPTISLEFMVNNSPFAGREGKFVTGRQIREYLEKELEVNVGLKVNFDSNESFKVSGRGELHIAILLENMRRAGFELQVSQPQVIIKPARNDSQDSSSVSGGEENIKWLEPFEELIADVPTEFQGVVIEKLGMRGFFMKDIKNYDMTVRIYFEGPTRGFLGYRNQFVIDTKGEGILSSRVLGFRPFAGEIRKKATGSMISMESGKALGYALWNLQDRGILYIGPTTEVYGGMVIGNTSKGEEMTVNPTKGKNLSNVRASGTDEAINLTPPFELTIERGLEVMSNNELLEITPKSVRLRKRFLTELERNKNRKDK